MIRSGLLKRRFMRLGAAIAAISASGVGDAAAQQNAVSEGGFYSFTLENDIFAGTDRDYTNGVRLDFISTRNDLPAFGRFVKRQLNPILRADDWYITYSLGQTMVTPSDISDPNPPRGERPYGGLLYGSVGLAADSGQQLNTVAVDIGVVGPLSGAEQAQKYVHDVIDAAKPLGWDRQLENEPVFRLLFEQKRRAFLRIKAPVAGLGVDALPHANVSLGTLDTSAGLGLTLRIGQNLANDYGPPRVRPAVGAPGFFDTGDMLRWHLFAGAEARAIGRNLLLEGNTFGGRDGVTIHRFVGDFQLGAALGVGPAEIAYTHVLRTEEYPGQDRFGEFGSLNLRAKF